MSEFHLGLADDLIKEIIFLTPVNLIAWKAYQSKHFQPSQLP